MPFSGTLERWHVMPGEHVYEGLVLADFRSQEVLELQNQWLAAKAELEQAEFLLQRDRTLLDQGIISRQRVQETARIATHARIDLNALGAILNRAGFNADTLEVLEQNTRTTRYVQFELSKNLVFLPHAHLLLDNLPRSTCRLLLLPAMSRPGCGRIIPVRHARSIEPGVILSLGGTREAVTVRFSDLAVRESTQTVEVLAEFNAQVDYLPGQILTLVVQPSGSGVLIPGDAVVFSGDETIVYFRTVGGVEAKVLDLEPAGSNYMAGPEVADWRAGGDSGCRRTEGDSAWPWSG